VTETFSAGEIEYLLRNQQFRLIYDSGDERSETAESLCRLGRSLLAGKGIPKDFF
jgi:hypothetical protein